LAEQKKREKEWASIRAAKMPKVIPHESASESSGSQCDEMSYLKTTVERQKRRMCHSEESALGPTTGERRCSERQARNARKVLQG